MSTITLSNWLDAKAALRNRDLRQGLYDEGIALMHGVIVNLHGAEHNARRRLENRLFRRETFAFWEKELIPHNISVSIQPHLVGGQVDLLQLARLTMMRISAGIAGIDLGDDPDRFNMLADIMAKLARASSVNHFIGDKQSVIEQGNIALELFATEFFEPARKNRLKLISEISQQARTVDDLPKDVLTTLLVNYDNLEISDESLLHEIAYFPWVGSHSTSGAFVNMMDHIFEWISHHPNDREKLVDDIWLLQRFGFESLRLNPASPESSRVAVVETTLESGVLIPQDARVTIDMRAANRDEKVFGSDAHQFNPYREISEGVTPWGLSFGSGFHACIGQELVSGLDNQPVDSQVSLTGAIATMAQIVLRHGAIVDPQNPPRRDEQSARRNWFSYPVVFRSPATDRIQTRPTPN